MAIILMNDDGTYANDCPLCNKALTDPFFATTMFAVDSESEMSPFVDAAMHWDCYATWEHQAQFANLVFLSEIDACRHNSFWSEVFSSDQVFISHGQAVKELSLVLRLTGSEFRVKVDEWPKWLEGHWKNDCNHNLEINAMEKLLPLLRSVKIP